MPPLNLIVTPLRGRESYFLNLGVKRVTVSVSCPRNFRGSCLGLDFPNFLNSMSVTFRFTFIMINWSLVIFSLDSFLIKNKVMSIMR